MPSTPSEKPGEDPSQWPDLQPWLRGMCSSMPLLAEHRDSCTDKGALRLSDLQFRVSRLELQVSQIGGLDDKHPSNHEVCELRKHVQASQAELQATRQEARETQEQLKLLLQHLGLSGADGASTVGASVMENHNGPRGAFRSFSTSTQGSPSQQSAYRAPSVHVATLKDQLPCVRVKKTEQLPRARSHESAARNRLYPAHRGSPPTAG